MNDGGIGTRSKSQRETVGVSQRFGTETIPHCKLNPYLVYEDRNPIFSSFNPWAASAAHIHPFF